jgi:glycosyltransferase involved in cell wall biosynthesis
MKPFLYVKGSNSDDVRLFKTLLFFKNNKHRVYFIGWDRGLNKSNYDTFNEKYIFFGGGLNNRYLMFYYPFWMISVFFYFLFKKNIKEYNIIAVNFDTALPIYVVSLIRDFDYIYEVYDEFSISYNFPSKIKELLKLMDKKLMNKAKLIIQVDKNRIRSHENKTIVIENSPFDYYEGKNRSYEMVKHKFAVTGLLNDNRGINQILQFAKQNGQIKFLFVGQILDDKMLNFARTLQNIELVEFIPQIELFKLIQDCCGIFSLYNPNIEINKLAASNKVYDAMMLGIPVITNKEVLNSKYIVENKIGFAVNYDVDKSWDFLIQKDFLVESTSIGIESRKHYLKNYVFDKILQKRLLENNFKILK